MTERGHPLFDAADDCEGGELKGQRCKEEKGEIGEAEDKDDAVTDCYRPVIICLPMSRSRMQMMQQALSTNHPQAVFKQLRRLCYVKKT